MPLRPVSGRSGGLTRMLHDARRHGLLFHDRRRRHLAVLAALIAVSAFVFVAVRPRTVRVVADGREVEIQTRQSSDEAVLRQSGVDIAEGDRVLSAETPGARVLMVDRARDVRIIADGQTYELRTAADTIEDALDEVDIVLQQRDSVMQDGVFVSENAPIEPPIRLASSARRQLSQDGATVEIEVRRAVPFVIVEGPQETVSTSSRQTIAQALREAGVVVGPGDVVVPDLQAPLELDTRIEVLHAHPVTIALPDGHRVVYTLARTVREVLDQEGIVLPAGAFVDPSFETPITSEMSVRVVQLGSTNDVAYEYIESSTVYESDPSLPPGQTRTVQGRDGVRVRRYNVTYVDGVEVGRELVEDMLDPEPVDTVIYYPTRTGRNESAPDVSSGAVTRTLRVYATAYNPASAGRSPDDPNYGVTASGAIVTYGIVAVDPEIIPLGTRMFVPGYGYAVAGDTGGAVKGYIIDLGFPDGVEIDWASQWVDIYIIE
ncbi:MAG TPA: ubiquitin-like domain-containing protein [Dehalococcoidia bacterium]|nr:ubiquitin-like domain-containing protein [Dehalococcoidia bacterium]